jgi:2Fe-2S ferredoxin
MHASDVRPIIAFEVKPTSPLSCQITVSDELDGLVVYTPAYQGR